MTPELGCGTRAGAGLSFYRSRPLVTLCRQFIRLGNPGVCLIFWSTLTKFFLSAHLYIVRWIDIGRKKKRLGFPFLTRKKKIDLAIILFSVSARAQTGTVWWHNFSESYILSLVSQSFPSKFWASYYPDILCLRLFFVRFGKKFLSPRQLCWIFLVDRIFALAFVPLSFCSTLIALPSLFCSSDL